MPLNNQPQSAPVALQLGVEAVQGGVKLVLVYPHMMVHAIIPEANIKAYLELIEKTAKEIPRVIVPAR